MFTEVRQGAVIETLVKENSLLMKLQAPIVSYIIESSQKVILSSVPKGEGLRRGGREGRESARGRQR